MQHRLCGLSNEPALRAADARELRQPKRTDQEVLIRPSVDERNAIGTLAHKKGVSIPAMIKLLVRDTRNLG